MRSINKILNNINKRKVQRQLTQLPTKPFIQESTLDLCIHSYNDSMVPCTSAMTFENISSLHKNRTFKKLLVGEKLPSRLSLTRNNSLTINTAVLALPHALGVYYTSATVNISTTCNSIKRTENRTVLPEKLMKDVKSLHVINDDGNVAVSCKK